MMKHVKTEPEDYDDLETKFNIKELNEIEMKSEINSHPYDFHPVKSDSLVAGPNMEEALINAVYKRRPIWDPTEELRKNVRILTQLWTEVAEEAGVSVKAAKTRWKNLRAYFVKELRKLENSKSDSSGNTPASSTWVFFDQLIFLKNAISVGDQRDFHLYNQDADDTVDIKTPISENENMDETSDDLEASSMFLEGNKEETSPSGDQTTTSRYIINTRKRLSVDIVARGKDDFHEKKKIVVLEKESAGNEDGDLLFFKSLLPYMRRFSELQKLRIRGAINTLILREFEALQ